MNEPIKQHYLPKTYLKRFVINENNRELRSFVYCFWQNQYETKTEKISIDSSKFKIDNFYTIENSIEPFAFEKYLGTEIEPLYERIIKEVQMEVNLSLECRSNLMIWLYFNKYRNVQYRENLERNIKRTIEIHSCYLDDSTSKEDDINQLAKAYSKKTQLESLVTEKIITKFDKGFGTKYWTILKSKPENQFLTNDNPGFSININMGIDLRTLNSFYATDLDASNFYILSPKYCLQISPFEVDTPKEISIRNQIINYKNADNQSIDMINKFTVSTSINYLIANSIELLNKYTTI